MSGYVWSPPAFLSPFILADGEAAYDRVALEMFLTVLIVVCVGVLSVRLILSHRTDATR